MSTEQTVRPAEQSHEPHAYIASGTPSWVEAAQEYWAFPLVMVVLLMDNASPIVSLLIFVAVFAQLFLLSKMRKPKPGPRGIKDRRTKPFRTVLNYVVLCAFVVFLLVCTFQQIKFPVGTAAVIGVAAFIVLILNAKFNVPSVWYDHTPVTPKGDR